MSKLYFSIILAVFVFSCAKTKEFQSNTNVGIRGDKFLINGQPTFEGREWNGYTVEGLLPNARLVQGVFDDLNPETAERWKYPDTNEWDANRNTNEFVAAMPEWRKHGMLAFTVNFQGGSPMGYGNKNWKNPGFESDGMLIPAYAERMERIVKKADQLGMVVILGIFYFGQDQFLQDEAAVKNAVDNVVDWIQQNGFTNIIIEVGNESNNRKYDLDILKENQVHELILQIKDKAPDLLVSTSFNGNTIPPDKVVEVSDFVLIHGNGVGDPARITEMVEQVRALPSYRPMPIVFNEDDHYDFDKEQNNFAAATKTYASWGYFDFRRDGENFDEGYQSVPVNWQISSKRKQSFFDKVQEIFITE